MSIAVKMKSIAAMSIVVTAIVGHVHGAGVEWPSDFWQQVTNRLESVASVPVDSGEEEEFVSCGIDKYALEFALGTGDAPFDSRLLSEKTSDPFEVYSFPRNFAVTIR